MKYRFYLPSFSVINMRAFITVFHVEIHPAVWICVRSTRVHCVLVFENKGLVHAGKALSWVCRSCAFLSVYYGPRILCFRIWLVTFLTGNMIEEFELSKYFVQTQLLSYKVKPNVCITEKYDCCQIGWRLSQKHFYFVLLLLVFFFFWRIMMDCSYLVQKLEYVKWWYQNYT